MSQSYGLVVFDALMLRYSILDDRERFFDEVEAVQVAFRGNFRILITDGILDEYQIESNKFPPFQLQPDLKSLFGGSRIIYFDDYRLDHSLTRSSIQLANLPREHRGFIIDAIAGRASYFITNRQAWLNLSDQTEHLHGLQIISPGRFVELES